MSYRKTPRVREQLADKRIRILEAARRLVSRGGFRETAMASVAAEAGVATGTVYRYFPSKSALFVDVVGRVSEREVEKVAAVARRTEAPDTRLREAVRLFATRALANRRLAYALIVEPSDPEVEGVRIRYRRSLAEAFAAIVQSGIADGSFGPQDAEFVGTCIVGALLESLIGPLARDGGDDAALASIEQFCMGGVSRLPATGPAAASRLSA
jgi:AcrR family transcriptional regulator